MWRRKAIDTAGGWNSRTTVEDMDLSLRAYLAGWKAIYLRHVTVLNEVRLMFCARTVSTYDRLCEHAPHAGHANAAAWRTALRQEQDRRCRHPDRDRQPRPCSGAARCL